MDLGVLILIALTLNLKLLSKPKNEMVLVLLFMILSIPLSSIAYASNVFHVNDPERVHLTIAAALSFISIALLALEKNESPKIKADLPKFVLFASFLVLITTTVSFKYVEWSQYYRNNSQLISILSERLHREDASKLLIIDQTEFFGDVYTLLNSADTLSKALAPRTNIILTVICNSRRGYSRTYASKYPIPAAENCSNVSVRDFDKIFVISTIEPVVGYFISPNANSQANIYLK